MKAYDNKTGLLKCALKSIMDPHGGLKEHVGHFKFKFAVLMII